MTKPIDYPKKIEIHGFYIFRSGQNEIVMATPKDDNGMSDRILIENRRNGKMTVLMGDKGSISIGYDYNDTAIYRLLVTVLPKAIWYRVDNLAVAIEKAKEILLTQKYVESKREKRTHRVRR